MKITNTMTRRKEEFIPLKTSEVTFYYCGPTVYSRASIGNMCGMVRGDLIHRSLKYLGYKVKMVRNLTDFGHLTGDNIGDADIGEDRMEKGARREGISPEEVATKYIKLYNEDTKKLHVLPVTYSVRATSYIKEMIELVKILIDKEYAYVTPRAIYFDVSKFPRYNDLNRQKLSQNRKGAGAGKVEDKNKRHYYDFAVWFFKTGVHKNALQYWESPFKSPNVEKGYGFPGWHIECSAMALKLLGDTIDIHMGGVEHIAIHHTNEIAQSEAATGKKFVNYWIHNEHLLINGKKMSKSLGNIYCLDDIINKGYSPLDLRYFFLQAHYRSKQNFTWEALEGARIAREKVLIETQKVYTEASLDGDFQVDITDERYQKVFIKAISNDFDIPKALGILWKTLNDDTLDKKVKFSLIFSFNTIFDIGIFETIKKINNLTEKQYKKIQKLIEARDKARKGQDWKKSDQIRDQLKEMHIMVQDEENQTQWYFVD